MKRSVNFFLAGAVVGIFAIPFTWPPVLTALEALFGGTAVFYAIIFAIPANMVFFGLAGAACSHLFPLKSGGVPLRRDPISAALAALENDHVIHEKFSLAGSRVIDRLVLGPTGAWIIHFMPDSGKITYMHHELAANGEMLKGDHFEDVLAQAEAVRNILYDRAGKEYAAHPVIVFTSSAALVRCGDRPIRGVRVVHLSQIKNLILRDPSKKLSAAAVREMEKALHLPGA